MVRPRSALDLQARCNALSVRREELARRFPGSFHLHGTAVNGFGARASPALVQEWERLGEDLRQAEAALAALRPSGAAAGP
jgi:hypothetical protein